MIKKMVGWPVSWGLYCMGHFVYLLIKDSNANWTYPIYNNLMWWSLEVNDWAGLSVWTRGDRNA